MSLKAQTRELIGKKVKQLRREKKLPAVLYGPNRKSTSIVLDPFEFRKLFEDVGYSKLFDLEIEGESNVKVLVKDLQRNILTDEFIHIDLYQVNMNKEITADIPIDFTGESFAVKNNLGLLVHPIQTISVTCLPAKLPPSLEVDISTLNEVGNSISAGDISLPEGVALANDMSPESPVAYIAAPQKTIEEEVAEESVTEGTEVASEDEAVAGTAGEGEKTE